MSESDEKRMRRALFMIGNSLKGSDWYDFRPISYDLAVKIAELAFAVAEGRPHEDFDAACARADSQAEKV